ncbi:MAG: Fe-S oxidoreductase [Cellulomonas sp. 73-92]|uniref:(Fe-S)-binding protein n=1 Tax=Cellulomonas sp. 73-92 TaxID=1895740 RepID=UPI00092C38C7|nr:(Fe-S)-binding protein [Cellulomonas sp. 73-92]OJV81046.1 MAG: Fe-S oxidoreductase [Cellulomonas sp. 73-92]
MSALRATSLALVVVATVVGVAVFVRGVWRITATIRAGRALAGRWRPVGPRLASTLREVLGHEKFAHNLHVRVAHWTVMVSFPILFITLVDGYGEITDARWTVPVIGHWPIVDWAVEGFAWLSLAGILWLIVRRQLLRPRASRDERANRASRFFGSSQAQAYVVEATVLVVVLAVLALRGLGYAIARQDGGTLASSWHFPLTAWYGAAWAGAPTSTLEAWVTAIATVKILCSMAWFVVVGVQPTMGVAWHRFLAVVTLYTKRYPGRTVSLGPAEPIRGPGGDPLDLMALDELPEDLVLGAGTPAELSWKAALDAATCTECGRCQVVCPAWATGKPLSPKLFMLSLRDALADPATRGEPLVGGPIDTDVLWACTTCGACVQECPVDIEHVDTILDLRRHQVLAASEFPRELTKAFTGMERQGNPWGAPARKRLDWTKGLDFAVPVVGREVASLADVDYLFWVGCAGAYDERAGRTTRAVAELLHAAGVTFAVLGEAEQCTGDSARRAGNELLFQQMAAGNIATLDAAGARRIVVTCAHCFNTIAREYPALGGTYEVVHHTELLNTLVADGRLVPLPASDARTVTYHDPCYLGRHNEIYSPPRELLAAAGISVSEMPRHGADAFCCGGGGARAWMEETIGTRIGTTRAAEAIGTGAAAVATACPFCTTMLTDGVAACGTSSPVGAVPIEAPTFRPTGGSTRPSADAPAVGVPEVADIAVLLRDRLTGARP